MSALTIPVTPRGADVGYMGILVQGQYNTIGGTASGAGNVISGNDRGGSFYAGVQLAIGTSTNTTRPATSFLGIDWPGANGEAIAGAVNAGVFISLYSSGNTIGGTTAAARNVISGNLNGVMMYRRLGRCRRGQLYRHGHDRYDHDR